MLETEHTLDDQIGSIQSVKRIHIERIFLFNTDDQYITKFILF